MSLFKDLIALWLGGFVNPDTGVGAAHGGVTSGSRALHLVDQTPQICPRHAAVMKFFLFLLLSCRRSASGSASFLRCYFRNHL